jgi:exosome complex RNA-binding protein Rrp42 (RNase PH superfamily)
MITPEILRSVEPFMYMSKFLEGGVRPDGREFRQTRDIVEVVGNVLRNESNIGSASARVGATSVIAGVQAKLVSLPEGIRKKQEQGKVIVEADFSIPLAGERRATQLANGDMSTKIGRVLNTVFDYSQLVEAPTEGMEDGLMAEEDPLVSHPVWHITIHLLITNDDGAVMDCALLAACAALRNSVLPSQRPVSFPVHPVAFTFCYSKRNEETVWLIDPTAEEERVLPRITLVVKAESQHVLGLFGPEGPNDLSVSERPGYAMSDLKEEVWPLVTKEMQRRVFS